MEKGIIFYTDNRLDPRISEKVINQLKTIELPIVSCSLEPINLGNNIVLPLKRGYLTMFKQILTALEASEADIIFHCEHDCLYPKEHFDFTPPDDKFYYDLNWWKIREDGLAVHWDAEQVSGLCGYRKSLIDWYRKRIENFDADNFDRKFEPMSYEGSVDWRSSVPYIDIRHRCNLTYNKWELKHFRKKETAINFQTSIIDKIPGWENLSI